MSNLTANILLTCLLAGAAPLTASAIEPHSVTSGSATVSENFDSMWDSAGEEAKMKLPAGWGVDRNLTAPRTIGKWSDASDEVMYAGGVSLPANAKNGTWNFGASDNSSDRAIGGLTTTVSNGTRGISLMTAITNADTEPVGRLSISYDIEKYRRGANAAGFTVQLYTSADGENWSEAGSAFRTLFPADSETAGTEIVPISTTEVADRQLLAGIEPGATLYLAWNISVTTGGTPDKAPGLAIDDIIITADYSAPGAGMLYVENATGVSPLSIYSTTTDFYGSAPGSATDITATINGVEYQVWDLPSDDVIELYAVAGDRTYGPCTVASGKDRHLCVSPEGIAAIADPDSYTGWVDPSRPPFVASGIYLRGDVNSWGASADWEFSDEGDGRYVLYDVTLSGTFKIADASWSGSCNYGSNGSNIMLDAPYELRSGTDSNISCGSYIYECKRVILTISSDGKAYLLLESDDDTSDLTSVYMAGDFNSWNFMDTTGELRLDEEDTLFKGRVSMKAGADGLSHWRIYQRLGMGSAWGLAEDAAIASISGTLLKGKTGNAAVEPGTYDVAFSLESGDYTLTHVESAPAMMTLFPVATVLTPENPEKVKVLSLNNSLIHYNDQDFVFNDIAAAEGADAVWTKHTNLGKPLSYHWEEGDGLAADGTPGAKMMIRSDAWSHIILQEQSSLPRTSPEKFRNSVEQWIGYIREYCPNPNAVIILPVNWAYSSDWSNFSDYNRQFIDIYTDVASELGCVVCPVAAAYDDIFRSEGSEVAGTLFSDDRHPTLPATYMAACMEYATIFGIDPAEITYVPEGVEASDAEKMRRYASRAIAGYNNAIDHLGRSIRFSAKVYDDFGIEMNVGKPEYSVDGGGSISEDGMFVVDGTEGKFTVTARCGGFEKSSVVKVASHLTEVVTSPSLKLNEENLSASEDFDGMGADAEAALPEAWRIDRQTVGTRTIGTYATALTSTTYSGGINLPSNAKNGVWNFGADDSSDRALGGITTGVANGSRAINLYTHLSNDGRKNVEKIRVSYDVEKYRKGNNQAGFAVQLHYSLDGRNWISAGDDFHTYLAPDQETAGYASVPGEVIPVEGVLPVGLGGGMDLYLAWNISVASGDAAQGAMALGIDNVKFEGQLPEVPQTDHRIYVDNRTSWDAIGLYAWGDGEIFGVWPGQAPIDELESDGTTWLVFGLDSAGGSYNLIFNNWNNNKQLPDFNITANRDYWLRIDDNGVTEIINTGVEEMEGAADGLRYDNGVLLSESAGEIRVYNMQGELLICGEGPALATGSLSRGLYIATSATAGALKFAVR